MNRPTIRQLADELAAAVEALHAHIVHIDAPVDARATCGFGDDEQRRLLQERPDLGRDHERLVPALDHPHVAGAQNAEPGFEHGLERILAGAELVIANAEEGEVVVDEPREKCDSFGDLVRRHRRRVGFELDDHILDALHHRPPVGNAEADVGKHPLDGRDDVGAARLIIDRFEMDVDDALARASRERLWPL